MATTPERARPIPVRPESKLGKALETAVDSFHPIVVKAGEAVYELCVLRAEPAPPDERALVLSIEGIRQAAGSWKDVDVEAFNAHREERRRLHTRRPARL